MVSHATDLESMHEITRRLVGLPLWEFWFAYGGELYLGFGGKRIEQFGPLAGQQYGEWELSTRASDWTLIGPDGLVRTSGCVDVEEAKGVLPALLGRRVRDVKVHLPRLGIEIEFDNGDRFGVECSHDSSCPEPNGSHDLEEDEDYEEPECWWLFTPDHVMLEVRTEGRWALKPDHREMWP